MYSNTSPILGTGTATAAQIDRFFELRGKSYAGAHYRPAPVGLGQMIVDAAKLWPTYRVNHDLLAAQVVHESAAWQSEYSRNRNNPSGLGAVNHDPDQAIRFETPADGLRATVAHLLTYVVGPGSWTEHDPRASATPAGWQGAVRVLRDLEQKWAFTPWDTYNATSPEMRYGGRVAALANELLKVEGGAMPGKRLIDMYDHTPTIDTSQVLSASQIAALPNFPHVGLRRLAGLTFHQTGNPSKGANAQAHRNFVANGGGSGRVSYQWTVDDTGIIQITPMTEACWHAGDDDGPGNMESNAIEMCINSDGDYDRTLYNAAFWGAWMIESGHVKPGWTRQHHAFSGKNCPMQIRNRGEWEWFLAGIADWRAILRGDAVPKVREFETGYTLSGGFLAFYERAEASDTHWSTIGTPLGPEMPGVWNGEAHVTVQQTDVGYLQWNPATGEVRMATEAQQRHIRASMGLDTPPPGDTPAGVDRDVVLSSIDALEAVAASLKAAVS